jgi:hypothetical protein
MISKKQRLVLDKIKNSKIRQFLNSIIDKEKIKFSLSQIREIVDIFLDLEENFNKILNDKELNYVITTPNLSKKEKGTKFYERLKAIRYPKLSQYRFEFKKELKKIIQQRKNITIETSTYFEDDNIKLSIKANSEAELEETLKYLLKITQEGKFSRIFDLIYGKIE